MSSDPTEAARRRLLPIVNQAAHTATAVAIVKAIEAIGPDTEATDENVAAFVKQRDDEAERLLREELVAKHGEGNVFSTTQLTEHFEPLGFMAPFIVVRRKADDKKGSLTFTHHPRFYFDFQADSQ